MNKINIILNNRERQELPLTNLEQLKAGYNFHFNIFCMIYKDHTKLAIWAKQIQEKDVLM
jgi:hypothetical protein